MKHLVLGIALLAGQALHSQTVYPPGASVQLGVLPDRWRTGGPRCMEVPDWQVHEYNPDFYILRQSGCTHYEKPFLYLIFGSDKALLIDTGAGANDVGRAVAQVIERWAARKQRTAPVHLVVAHSHGHGDHVAGDKQFENLPNVTLVAANTGAIAKAFHIDSKSQTGSLDLGSRMLDILAIPGHEDASLAVYDRQTGILLTGDTFYPGRLYVTNWPAYAASAQRLVDFTDKKVVTHILGAHIEQMRTPYSDYPRGTIYQPEEHHLALSRGDLIEWNLAVRSANGVPTMIALRDVTIVPRTPQTSEQTEQTRREYQAYEKRQESLKWDQTKN